MTRLRTIALIATVAVAGALPAHAQDAEAGALVFKRHCKICHSPLEGKNMVGPSLFAVIGRPAGAAPNFKYSQANKSSGITWDTARVESYLINPRSVVPRTPMTFRGLKDAQQRADVIAYLQTLK